MVSRTIFDSQIHLTRLLFDTQASLSPCRSYFSPITLNNTPTFDLSFPVESWQDQQVPNNLLMRTLDSPIRYSVREDIKLKHCPTPPPRIPLRIFLSFLNHSHYLYPISDASETIYLSADVTSCFSPYVSLLSSGVHPKIEASFSSYCLMTELKEEEEEEEREPEWVHPDEDLENLEICEDETLAPDAEEDVILFPTIFGREPTPDMDPFAFTAYKRVDQKVNPVSGTFPEEARVHRRIPIDPLLSLPKLASVCPPLVDTPRMNQERLAKLEINSTGFLWPQEVELFNQVMWLNQNAIAFEEDERGTLKESYFTPYIIPTVPHTAWEYRNIPIPPVRIKDKVIELLKHKINAGVYEPSQSAYRSRWFCVLKKNGKLRIVHDLQPLNKVTIRDAGLPPIVDDFIEPFAGRQCYTVFDLFWGFDARRVHPESRDLTAFLTPLGLLRLTSLPMGFTNSPAEFQKCMTFILHDEIPDVANIFIDDLPIKGPKSQYPDKNGDPEVLEENPGIRRFIWEHAQDVHRVMHRIGCAGGTFASNKTQIC
jgi:hypothetical protein